MSYIEYGVNVPSEPIDRVLQLQNIMIERVTYNRCGEEDRKLYTSFRQELMQDEVTRSHLPQAVRVCRVLDHLWDFIKPKYGTYADRREYFRGEFEPLLSYLENRSSSPVDDLLDDALKDFSTGEVQRVWRRASERLGTSPDAAITSARALLESVCKHILEAAGEQCDDLDNIYRQAAKLLNLAPDQQSEQAFKQLSGSCNSIVGSLNSIRNRFGDAHGHGSSDVNPSPRHAELTVNVAGSLSLFLVRTEVEPVIWTESGPS